MRIVLFLYILVSVFASGACFSEDKKLPAKIEQADWSDYRDSLQRVAILKQQLLDAEKIVALWNDKIVLKYDIGKDDRIAAGGIIARKKPVAKELASVTSVPPPLPPLLPSFSSFATEEASKK